MRKLGNQGKKLRRKRDEKNTEDKLKETEITKKKKWDKL